MGAEWISLVPAGATFDISRDLIATADESGRFQSLNLAWETCLGWTREELMQRPYVEFIHPDDLQESMAESTKIVDADYEVANFDNRYRTKSGDYRWLRWSARTDGALWLAVAIDITDEREAEQTLRAALDNQGLLLYAQPIVDPWSRRLVQRELLVRMYASCPLERRPGEEPEILLPASFLPAAERLGMIGLIDRWVTSRALSLAQRGRPVEVNLSAQTVCDEDFATELLELLDRAPETARNLVFEITETAAIANLDAAQHLGTALTKLGSRLALDDFGTGFGSFTYLRWLPVDYLKIDSSFVQGVTTSREDQAVVRSVVHIAASFGRATVAEGVEDAATLDLLCDLGITHAQGYYTGRPEPVLS